MSEPYRYSARLALIALLSLLAGACSRGEATAPPRAALPAAEGAPSLFELTFSMTDQTGRTRRLEDFRGRPFVAAMIYTNCTSVCPRITADLKRLEAALESRDRERTRFVLVSLDPERDTPAALESFAAQQKLDTARWTLLAATPGDMRTLAAVLDVRFRPDADGEIAHSAVIAIVDRDGIVRHRQVGLTDDPAPLTAVVRALD